MTDDVKPPAEPKMVVSRETRDRPGPRSFVPGEIVYVSLKNPPGSESERTWYQARVIRSSSSRMVMRVVGTGTEVELRTWDVRWFVRKLDEGPGT